MWKALLGGVALGYVAAQVGVHRAAARIVASLADLPSARNLPAVALVLVGLLALYATLIFAPLWYIAAAERASHGDEWHAPSRLGFRENLRRRGSVGSALAFLGELEPSVNTAAVDGPGAEIAATRVTR